jgi:hypothetical protein
MHQAVELKLQDELAALRVVNAELRVQVALWRGRAERARAWYDGVGLDEEGEGAASGYPWERRAA